MAKKPLTYAEGGKKGGSVKGPQKRRSAAHYLYIGRCSSESRRLGRKLTDREKRKIKRAAESERAVA